MFLTLGTLAHFSHSLYPNIPVIRDSNPPMMGLYELCERHSVIWLRLCCVDLNWGGGLGLCLGAILRGG
jgi:hypothetical protein